MKMISHRIVGTPPAAVEMNVFQSSPLTKPAVFTNDEYKMSFIYLFYSGTGALPL